jgi:hypothetical protein
VIDLNVGGSGLSLHEGDLPAMSSQHVGIPVYLHEGQFSAFGTSHPIDKALGRLRRIQSYKSSATGQHSHSDILHAASALSKSPILGD